MDECKTLDELIAALEKEREKLGGGTRVLYRRAFRDDLAVLRLGRGAVGKTSPFRLVSRGGNPVVLIGS